MVSYAFNDEDRKALILAVVLSLGVHLFWLFAIKVVVAPNQTLPAKFSKVSFLGPIFARAPIEVRVSPRPRSFLEKRYLTGSASALDYEVNPSVIFTKHDARQLGLRPAGDKRLIHPIMEAIDESKSEPSYYEIEGN